jgi:GxxExxY protein
MAFEGKHSNITEKIIGAFYKVYNQLGHGFSEKVYENAFVFELKREALEVVQQAAIKVFYEDILIGEFFADLLVNQVVMIEIKAVQQLSVEHEAQLMNYLKATNVEIGLLLNFGPKAQYKRKIFDNDRKGSMNWTKRLNKL